MSLSDKTRDIEEYTNSITDLNDNTFCWSEDVRETMKRIIEKIKSLGVEFDNGISYIGVNNAILVIKNEMGEKLI